MIEAPAVGVGRSLVVLVLADGLSLSAGYVCHFLRDNPDGAECRVAAQCGERRVAIEKLSRIFAQRVGSDAVFDLQAFVDFGDQFVYLLLRSGGIKRSGNLSERNVAGADVEDQPFAQEGARALRQGEFTGVERPLDLGEVREQAVVLAFVGVEFRVPDSLHQAFFAAEMGLGAGCQFIEDAPECRRFLSGDDGGIKPIDQRDETPVIAVDRRVADGEFVRPFESFHDDSHGILYRRNRSTLSAGA